MFKTTNIIHERSKKVPRYPWNSMGGLCKVFLCRHVGRTNKFRMGCPKVVLEKFIMPLGEEVQDRLKNCNVYVRPACNEENVKQHINIKKKDCRDAAIAIRFGTKYQRLKPLQS